MLNKKFNVIIKDIEDDPYLSQYEKYDLIIRLSRDLYHKGERFFFYCFLIFYAAFIKFLLFY